MKKRLSTIVLILILITGLSLLLYPTVSDYWNSFHQTQAIASYQEAVEEMDEESYEEMLNQARAYNEALWSKGNHFKLSEEEEEEYESLLNISGSGMMGYVEVPRINCSLPVYHGMDDEILQVAVGHLIGSSLPVGGASTHCVLTAHRGLPSAKLFTNLDKLTEGDIFELKVLNETLTYEVDQIRIVEPEDVEELELVEGKDYCTLVTCTPYGVNTHRLLVRGHRTANRLDESGITGEAVQIKAPLAAIGMAVPVLLILLLVMLIRRRKR